MAPSILIAGLVVMLVSGIYVPRMLESAERRHESAEARELMKSFRESAFFRIMSLGLVFIGLVLTIWGAVLVLS